MADRRREPPDVVVGIGGGAALDAAKAIAGLLRTGTSVLDHLEGVGRGLPYPGPATPFIAVPTTAGTGSEATRNAVISGRLPGAAADDPPFKKSFRDERLVATVALLDPELLAGCPPAVIAGDGMDALTQLLEAFTSTGASPFSDAVARSGLAAIGAALARLARGRARPGRSTSETAPEREAMAWAALCSGIALANAGPGRGPRAGRAAGGAVRGSPRDGLRRARRGRHPHEPRRARRARPRVAGAGPLRGGGPPAGRRSTRGPQLADR